MKFMRIYFDKDINFQRKLTSGRWCQFGTNLSSYQLRQARGDGCGLVIQLSCHLSMLE